MGRVSKFVLTALFSHVGLTFLVSIYCIGGAFMFRYIELPEEREQLNATIDFARKLEETDFKRAAVEGILQAAWDDNSSKHMEEVLMKYDRKFEEGVLNYSYAGSIPSRDNHIFGWSIPSSILFTATILTTIGYGHVYPTSKEGQMAVILYALFAIPLMTMFISDIGSLSSKGIQFVYHKVCCGMCFKKKSGKTAVESLEDDDTDPQPQNIPVVVIVAIVVVYLGCGILLFAMVEEHWDVIGSIYFCFISLLTIGFGDLVPGVQETGVKGIVITIVSAVYIIIGLAVLATGAELCLESLHSSASKLAKRRKEKREHEGEHGDKDPKGNKWDGDYSDYNNP